MEVTGKNATASIITPPSGVQVQFLVTKNCVLSRAEWYIVIVSISRYEHSRYSYRKSNDINDIDYPLLALHVQLWQLQQTSFLRLPLNATLRPANHKPYFMLALDRQLKPTNDKHTRAGVRETETETHTQLGDFLASLATFQTLLATLFLKSD